MGVALRSARESFVATSKNIGIGGLFVTTDRRLSVGNRFAVEFTLPDHIHPTSVDAEVRWIFEMNEQPRGVGLSFANPSIGTMVALYDLLRKVD
jgi:Tfp pilus assembly protein PilZ